MTSDILTNTRNAINTAMDQATGGKYSAARLQYRNDMAVPEAFQTGVDALGGTGIESRPEFLQAWKDAPERTPEEIQAAQLGMRTAADNMINGRRFSARNGENIGEVPFNVQKMNILLGPGEGSMLADRLGASKDIATTNSILFGGSKTALAQAAQRQSGGVSNMLTAASTALPALAGAAQGAGLVNSALLGAGGFAVRKAAQAADAAHNTATARLAVMPGSEALRAIYGAKPPSVFDNLLTRGGAGGRHRSALAINSSILRLLRIRSHMSRLMKKSPSQCAPPAAMSAFNDGLMGQTRIRTIPKQRHRARGPAI